LDALTFRRYAAERLVVLLLALFCAAALTYLCFHVFAQSDPGRRPVPASRGRRAARTHVRAARRTALIVLVKGVLRDVGWLIGAAALVEIVFSFPGLGLAVVRYVDSRGIAQSPRAASCSRPWSRSACTWWGIPSVARLSREWRET
jgi:hypothetical protein